MKCASKLIKKTQKITTYNQLNLETLGFDKICPKFSSDTRPLYTKLELEDPLTHDITP